MNNVVLVGRLVRDPEVKKLDNEKEVSNITLAVTRNYKNEEGVYETDFIDCTLWNTIAKSTAEYCKKGDIVGVKGRHESESYDKEGKTFYKTNIVVEKITFLSSKRELDKTDKELE